MAENQEMKEAAKGRKMNTKNHSEVVLIRGVTMISMENDEELVIHNADGSSEVPCDELIMDIGPFHLSSQLLSVIMREPTDLRITSTQMKRIAFMQTLTSDGRKTLIEATKNEFDFDNEDDDSEEEEEEEDDENLNMDETITVVEIKKEEEM